MDLLWICFDVENWKQNKSKKNISAIKGILQGYCKLFDKKSEPTKLKNTTAVRRGIL